MFGANLGDTKALLCRYRSPDNTTPENVQTLLLSKEHSPTVYEERQRIQKAGGLVTDGRVQGILEVSRSLGDGRFKALGVISQPHTVVCTLTPLDRCLLIACDGLWNAMPVAEVVQFLFQALEATRTDPLLTDDKAKAVHVAARLVNEAVHRGSGDNVSVVLTLIRPAD